MTFIQMVGVPGSGKTEKVKILAKEYNASLLSSDAIREEILGDVSDQTKNNMAPYFWKEEKTHNKYKRLFGDQFLMLHSCDKEAH